MSTPNRSRVLLLEFNELTPTLMDRFMKQGRLPNFSRLRSQAEVYETMASEVAPDLEPWIQWVTVHTGLDYCDHQLFHLNEGHNLQSPRIWDVLSKAGYTCSVFGSMNVNYQPDFRGVLVPDPWCTEVQPSPELDTFFRFIQRNVLEYSNDRVPLTKRDYFEFLKFVATHGMSFHTVTSIVRQLILERSKKFKWKRAVLLDKIQFDVFRWYWTHLRPSFATFFANSTAHFQHSYWRNMDPDSFDVKPTNPKPDEYENAICFGYEQMDTLVGKFLDLVDKNTTLIFSTAISQQPCLKYESMGGAYFHRSKDFTKFLDFAGVKGYGEVAPVMTHQFHIDFDSDSDAQNALDILADFEVGGAPLLQLEKKGQRLFAGCRIYKAIDISLPVVSKDTGKSSPFSQFFYRMETNKSGMHHPLGMLWIRKPSGEHKEHSELLPLRCVADKVLQPFGLSMANEPELSASLT